MGKAFYRRYRSKNLSEIVGQEHITDTLGQALKNGRISHAYLFTGPRGVGKTSIARILAYEINNLPYEDDSPHIDIIEIDAASNRRIEEIRELRDKVHVAPTSAKYKVYIIDEVHMLTREAFNALLKTLEEPPAHVVFILATTDAHKLPETIVSRTQRYTFKPVDKDKVKAHLKHIAKLEKITVSDEALDLLAEHGDGSFRDSISLLDQASSHGKKLEIDDVRQLLGIPPADSIVTLTKLLSQAEPKLVVQSLAELYNQGYQASMIAKQISQNLRQQILSNRAQLAGDKLFPLLSRLLEVPVASEPERMLEILLLETQTNITEPSASANEDTIQVIEAEASIAEPVATDDAPAKTSPEAAHKKATDSNHQPAKPNVAAQSLDNEAWPKILQALKQRHNTLYGVVRMAQPEFEDNTLKLTFAFAFHQKRISEATNQRVLADVIKDVTGESIIIECTVDKQARPPKLTVHAEVQPKPPAQDLKAISNIFGGAELLES